MNEILLRGATPVAPMAPVAAPAAAPDSPTGDFSKVLLAELEGPATAPAGMPTGAATGASDAPVMTAPRPVTLESLPAAPAPVMVEPPAPPAPPRLAPPVAAPAAAPAPAAVEGPAGTYTVKAGDSLSKIARKVGHGNWRQLYAANRDVVGANPDVIKPGQVLTLPQSWQAAHAAKPAPVSAAPPVRAAAAVEAPAAAAVAPTGPAPTVAPPALPIEAASEPSPTIEGPDAYGPSAPMPSMARVAGEAIDRLTAEPGGGPDHLATLHEALKAIPATDPAYATYRAKVEAYENGIVAPPPAGAAPAAVPATFVPAPPLDSAVPAPVVDPAGGGAGVAPVADEEDWQAFS